MPQADVTAAQIKATALNRPLARLACRKEKLLGYGSEATKGVGLRVHEEQHPENLHVPMVLTWVLNILRGP